MYFINYKFIIYYFSFILLGLVFLVSGSKEIYFNERCILNQTDVILSDNENSSIAIKFSQNSSIVYNVDGDCDLTFKTKNPQNKLLIVFSLFNFTAAGKELINQLETIGGNNKTFILNFNADPTIVSTYVKFEADSNTLVLSYTSNVTNASNHFSAVVTSYSEGSCKDDEYFQCQKKKACIWGKLKCNGIINCFDDTDEDPLLCSKQPSTRDTVMGVLVIVFGIAALFIFLPLIVYVSVRGSRNSVSSNFIHDTPSDVQRGSTTSNTFEGIKEINESVEEKEVVLPTDEFSVNKQTEILVEKVKEES